MAWIAALALAALNPQVSHNNEVSCDLAPFLGRGSSSEGSLDTLTGLSLGCAVVLYDGGRWTVGPRVALTEQSWTIYRQNDGVTRLDSFQARTLGLGFHTDFALNESWNIQYTLTFAQGQGSQEQNVSTANSTDNVSFKGMTQRSLQHDVALAFRFTPRVSLLTGLQFDAARQTWDPSTGRLEQENVAPGNRLTLTSGSSPGLQDEIRDSSRYHAVNLHIGLSLLLN